jgi:hypothetical protein
MTLGQVRGFFRGVMNGLKYREWADGFNIANIPATILDGSYHLDVGHIKISPTMGAQARAFEFSYPVTLKVLSKGFKNPGLAIDRALDNAQGILEVLMPQANALTQVGIKNVSPTGLDTQPLQVSNDNAVILVMTFDMYLILAF